MGRSEGGSEGRATDIVKGMAATTGGERRECRRASSANETDIAGAWVIEPQGE